MKKINALRIAGLTLLAVLGASLAGAQTYTRINVTANGTQPDGDSARYVVRLTPDGRYALFDINSTNITPGSTATANLYVKDLKTGALELISVNKSGVGGNGLTSRGDISADGRFVVFISLASDLVDGDTKGKADVFLRDRKLGTTTRIHKGYDGSEASASAEDCRISQDGRYIIFSSDADNLMQGDTNSRTDVFVYDRIKATTERISLTSTNGQCDNNSLLQDISADGRYVLFSNFSSTVVPNDTNNAYDLFLRDRYLRTTTRVSLGPGNLQGDTDSRYGRLSADGRLVAWETDSSNFGSGSNNRQVYARDLRGGGVGLISKNASDQVANAACFVEGVSAGGRYITFYSSANNLTATSNGFAAMHIKDLYTGTVVMPLTTNNTNPGSLQGGSYLRPDGKAFLFNSGSTGIVNGVNNNSTNLFLRSAPSTVSDDLNQVRLQNTGNGGIYLWLASELGIVDSGSIWAGGDKNWVYKGAPDLNGDGQPDAIFQYNTGKPLAWIMGPDGDVIASSGALTANGTAIGALANWNIVATPDLNHDGKSDILLQNSQTGAVYYWIMNGTTITSQGTLWAGGDKNWRLFAAVDLDENGTPDCLLQHNTTGQVYRWTVGWNGTAPVLANSAYVYSSNLTAWTAKFAQRNPGTGTVSVILTNNTNNSIYEWVLTNGVITKNGYLYSGSLTSWNVVATEVLTVNPRLALYLQDKTTGAAYTWYIRDSTILTNGYLYSGNISIWKLLGQ